MNSHDTAYFFYTHILDDALSLLPGRMDSREARAMLLAIGFQESEFRARRQGGGGPARGFWQFERAGGIAEILESSNTKDHILPVCKILCIEPTRIVCHAAVEYNDVLAACFARLLLWRDPRDLPTPIEVWKGWDIYVDNWRPGKPHRGTWMTNFNAAWDIVKGGPR